MAKIKKGTGRDKAKGPIMIANMSGAPDKLLSVQFVSPSSLTLVFCDSFQATLKASKLEIPLSRIRWQSANVGTDGDSMTLETKDDATISVDSSTLRYLVDKAYAVEIDAELKRTRPSRDELREFAKNNPPPSDWYEGADKKPIIPLWE